MFSICLCVRTETNLVCMLICCSNLLDDVVICCYTHTNKKKEERREIGREEREREGIIHILSYIIVRHSNKHTHIHVCSCKLIY